MNALRTFGFGLAVAAGLVPAANVGAQCPTWQPYAAPVVAKVPAQAPVQAPAQVTQRRAFSYEPALAAPTRVYTPMYYRGTTRNYNSQAPWMTPKTLR